MGSSGLGAIAGSRFPFGAVRSVKELTLDPSVGYWESLCPKLGDSSSRYTPGATVPRADKSGVFKLSSCSQIQSHAVQTRFQADRE